MVTHQLLVTEYLIFMYSIDVFTLVRKFVSNNFKSDKIPQNIALKYKKLDVRIENK